MSDYTVREISGRFAVVNGNDMVGVFDTNEMALFLIQLLTGEA